MVSGQGSCLQSMSNMTSMQGFIILAIIATMKTHFSILLDVGHKILTKSMEREM